MSDEKKVLVEELNSLGVKIEELLPSDETKPEKPEREIETKPEDVDVRQEDDEKEKKLTDADKERIAERVRRRLRDRLESIRRNKFELEEAITKILDEIRRLRMEIRESRGRVIRPIERPEFLKEDRLERIRELRRRRLLERRENVESKSDYRRTLVESLKKDCSRAIMNLMKNNDRTGLEEVRSIRRKLVTENVSLADLLKFKKTVKNYL